MTLHKLKINSLIGLFIAALSGSSCTKLHDFGNLNTDPTVTTAPVTSALLTNVLSNLAVFTWDAGNIPTISGLYSQYYSETQYTDVSIYSKQSLGWDNYYASAIFSPPNVNQYTPTGYLSDLQTIINYNTDPTTKDKAAASGSNANQLAIARILKVYVYSTLTDIYGDIPYSKALAGDNGTVAYDKQQDIYTDMFKELTAAVAQFDGGATVSGDILLGGSVAKWKKFANSLHALLALHLSKVDPTTGKKEFAAALAGGVIGEGEDIRIAFPGGNFLSPVYKYYDVTKRFDYAVSKTMTDLLAANSDPHCKSVIFRSSTGGCPFCLSRDNDHVFAITNSVFVTLWHGSTGSKATDPFNVITAGEIYLSTAEAAPLGGTGEDASAMYSLRIKTARQV